MLIKPSWRLWVWIWLSGNCCKSESLTFPKVVCTQEHFHPQGLGREKEFSPGLIRTVILPERYFFVKVQGRLGDLFMGCNCWLRLKSSKAEHKLCYRNQKSWGSQMWTMIVKAMLVLILLISWPLTLAILSSSHVASEQILKTKYYAGAVIPRHGRRNGSS